MMTEENNWVVHPSENESLRDQKEVVTVPGDGSQWILAEAGSPGDQRTDSAHEEPDKQRESNGEKSARTGLHLRDGDR